MIDQLHLANHPGQEIRNLGLVEAKINALIAELNMSQKTYAAQEVIPSAARTASANFDFELTHSAIGAIFYLEVTADPGTATLDLQLQRYDPVTETYHAVTGAAFAQATAVGSDVLIIYPGIAETANETVNDVLSHKLRWVSTIGGAGGMTWQMSMEPLG